MRFTIFAAAMLASTTAFADPPAGGAGPRGEQRSERNRDGGDREHGAFADALHQQQQDLRDFNAGDRVWTNPNPGGVYHPDKDLNLGQWGVYICGEDGVGACGR